MLVLSRKIGEQIVLPGLEITVSVQQIHGGRVVMGVDAPRNIPIRRGELSWIGATTKYIDQNLVRSPEIQHATVLLAAPPSLLRNEFRAALVRRGLQALTADDGVQCLEFLRKSLPDVLVLELELPWGGGDGVLEVFHQELDLHEVPVFALTTGRSRSSMYRISRFTISDIVVLPVSAERLANRVVRLAKQRRAVSA